MRVILRGPLIVKRIMWSLLLLQTMTALKIILIPALWRVWLIWLKRRIGEQIICLGWWSNLRFLLVSPLPFVKNSRTITFSSVLNFYVNQRLFTTIYILAESLLAWIRITLIPFRPPTHLLLFFRKARSKKVLIHFLWAIPRQRL